MMVLSRQAISGTAALPRRVDALHDPLALVASVTAATLVTAWAFGAGLVLLRRVSGGFSEPPTAVMPWVAVMAGMTIVIIMDAAFGSAMPKRWTNMFGRFGTVLAVLAVMPFAESAGRLAAGLVPLGIAVTGLLLPKIGEHRHFWPRKSFCRVTSLDPSPRAPLPSPKATPAAPLPAGFRQRLERFQTETDGDRAIGRVIVDVPAGSRSGHAHIGFCPPFAAMPSVEVTSDDDGFEAVVTAAEIVPWGVRVECRLSESAEEPLAIPVDVVAHCRG